MSTEQVKTKIVDCISMVAPGPHVILYVSKIGRCTDEEIQSLQYFRQLFPGNPYPYTIMLFTGSDYLQKTNDTEKTEIEEKETLEMAYVGKLPRELKKFLEKCNQRKMFFNNNLRDPCSIEKQTESLLDLIEQMREENAYTFYQNHNPGDIKRDTKKCSGDETLKTIEYTSNLSIVLGTALMISGYVQHSWKLYGILIGIRALVEVIKRRRQKHKESKFTRVRNILQRDHSVCVVS
ncbi:unnamed protein product [Mytilus coruscus]|uniref:AIG1-type G domain-containing protein n=1 Tax=Mytilus coruscus TaxID=42192 RepID=A0A6J7ZT78_MYTCO|nr:unnamed protein product [Mytilus coruscus]